MGHEGIPSPMPPERHTAAIDELATHIRGLAADLRVEREAREKIEKNGISVLSLRVPFLLWFATVGPLVGIGVGVGLFFHRANDHMSDTQIHVDRDQALAKKGVAYTRDVEEKISGVESEVTQNDRAALRLMLKERPLVCGAPRGKNRTQECSFGDQKSWNR